MLGTQFIDTLTRLKVTDYTGVEDFADKLSFLYSVVVLSLCTMIIAVKQYLLAAIACYVPTVPSGSDFDKFLENYCWVHGTIPILAKEMIPQKSEKWAELDKTHRINYYQWVPFMLGLQCILFYLPRVVWQVVCYNRTGTDLEHLVVLSNRASHTSAKERENLIFHVAGSLEAMLFQHRDFRKGRIAEARRHFVQICGPLFASKRLGTWLVFSYFIIKMMYFANSVGQLLLMQRFLGFNDTMGNFGYELAGLMIQGRDWHETRFFPRISYCFIENIRHMGARNSYTAQCVLPVNMLNEKVYIFLWFWTALVATCTAISLPLWITRVCFGRNRIHFIRKYLRLNDSFTPADKSMSVLFVIDFLRYDGVFILQMISLNAGDVVTSEIVSKLWELYKRKYSHRTMLKDIPPNYESSSPKKEYLPMSNERTKSPVYPAPTAPVNITMV